jgi:toxin ParE1/3/4
MNVRFSRQARADLNTIIATIASDNPRAARRFGRLLRDRALSLSHNPYRGTAVKRSNGLRRLLVGPYLILYDVADDRVEILQIVHGARDLRRVVRHRKPERNPD